MPLFSRLRCNHTENINISAYQHLIVSLMTNFPFLVCFSILWRKMDCWYFSNAVLYYHTSTTVCGFTICPELGPEELLPPRAWVYLWATAIKWWFLPPSNLVNRDFAAGFPLSSYPVRAWPILQSTKRHAWQVGVG